METGGSKGICGISGIKGRARQPPGSAPMKEILRHREDHPLTGSVLVLHPIGPNGNEPPLEFCNGRMMILQPGGLKCIDHGPLDMKPWHQLRLPHNELCSSPLADS